MGKKLILFATTLLSSSMMVAQNTHSGLTPNGPESGWYINFNAGVGVLGKNSNLSPLGMSYRSNYKSGYTVDAQAGYQGGNLWRAGVRYNQFWTSGDYKLSGDASAAESSDDVKVYYIAPQLAVSVYSGKRVNLWLQAGAGYMGYKNKFYNFYANGDKAHKLDYTSSSIGVNGDIKLDYKLTKTIFLNASVSGLYGGNFKKLKVKDEDNAKETVTPEDYNRIKLWRTDFTLGLTFKF